MFLFDSRQTLKDVDGMGIAWWEENTNFFPSPLFSPLVKAGVTLFSSDLSVVLGLLFSVHASFFIQSAFLLYLEIISRAHAVQLLPWG